MAGLGDPGTWLADVALGRWKQVQPGAGQCGFSARWQAVRAAVGAHGGAGRGLAGLGALGGDALVGWPGCRRPVRVAAGLWAFGVTPRIPQFRPSAAIGCAGPLCREHGACPNGLRLNAAVRALNLGGCSACGHRVELKFSATWCYCPCGTMGLVLAGTACLRCGRSAVSVSPAFGRALVQAGEIVPNSGRVPQTAQRAKDRYPTRAWSGCRSRMRLNCLQKSEVLHQLRNCPQPLWGVIHPFRSHSVGGSAAQACAEASARLHCAALRRLRSAGRVPT